MKADKVKFRCWCNYYDRYFYWDELKEYSAEDIFTEDATNSFYGGLQQYTGFNDKNGKEIYDGDILDDGSMITKVEYMGFIRNVTNTQLRRMEVIGNIYENHELTTPPNDHH